MTKTHGGDRRRRVGAVAALAAAGMLAWPGTAYAADVTTNPTQARQGDAVRLEFTVPEERAGATTRQIEVRLPADAPVAEVYPMSVTGWAPRISSRTLDRPVTGIHSSGVSTVTTAVTWIRVRDAAPGPARLALSMGPLPQADRLTFEVLQTYSDGTVVRWADATGAHRAPVLTLLPAAPGAAGAAGAAGHSGHGAPGADAANDSAAAPGDAADAPGGTGSPNDGVGNADGMLAAGLLAGLGGGAAIGWLVSRWRRRDPAERAALAEVTGGADELPAPTEPTPTGSTPNETTATGSTPTETTATSSTPTSSTPIEPRPTEPAPTEPAPTGSAPEDPTLATSTLANPARAASHTSAPVGTAPVSVGTAVHTA
ncbi:DUF1775 domain-containing protein [Micromonospora sp. GCM10011542]|uniref:DUF1775 domain-containing protein n=1 Tax=Micromonospora sp. GCM10011542 TaxID=3317337 RepID=UPI0036164EBD